MMLRRLSIAGALLLVGCSGAEPNAGTGTTSQSAASANDPAKGMMPPQEAIDACANASEGASCSLSFDGHAFTGTCRNGPDDDGPLACAPPHPPPGPMMKPPPEAFEACKSLAEQAACSVHVHDRDIAGKCLRGPDGKGELACVPPHPMGPPKEAIDACASLSAGAACSVSFAGADHAGTCRNGPEGQAPLACAPKDLPPPPEP